MMSILALDFATRTGWALRRDDGSLLSGVENFKPTPRDSRGMLFLRASWWLESIVHRENVRLIVFEQAHQRGGAATEIVMGLISDMQRLCASVALSEIGPPSVEYESVHSSTLKKFATGNGRASKDEMIRVACLRWPDQSIRDDNQADALWLLAYIESQKPKAEVF